VRDRKACECRMVEWSEEKVGYLLRDVYGVTEPGEPQSPLRPAHQTLGTSGAPSTRTSIATYGTTGGRKWVSAWKKPRYS
jgi:hypothetical protein